MGGDDDSRVVLTDNLPELAALMNIQQNGCWVPSTTGRIHGRASGDQRPNDELPEFKAHRWTWLVAHGLAHEPGRAASIQLRRECETKRCCNPHHIYATRQNGDVIPEAELAALINPGKPRVGGPTDGTRAPAVQHDVLPPTAGERGVANSVDAPSLRLPHDVETSAEPRTCPLGTDIYSHDVCAVAQVPEPYRGESPDQPASYTGEERSPHTWIEAFPWLKGAAESGSTHWWTEPIDGAGATRDQRLATISDLAMKHLTRWTIGQIFPGLPADLELRNLERLTTRARNILGREGCSFAADLAGTRLDSILDWRQIGVETVDAILQALTDASTWIATPTVTTHRKINRGGDSVPCAEDIRPGSISSVTDDLTRIAVWYNTIGCPNQRLIGDPAPAGTPSKIVEALERLQALRPGDILTEHGCTFDLAALFDDALSVLDWRAIDVLSERLFADEPATLDQLGRKHDVTRERIRQIEGKARGTLMSTISGDGPLAMVAASARELIGVIRPLDDLLEQMPALGKEIEQIGQPVWRVLDRLDDAYEIEAGWCVVPTMTAALELTRTQLQERVDQYGVIRLDELELVESSHPEKRPDLTASWLTHCGYIVHGEFVLTHTSSVGDYAAAVLSLEGSPLSSQEIVDRFVFDRSTRSLGNALGADDRFERVDRDRWALKEWGMEAYTGIRSMIRELVARSGGRARLHDVVEYITARYSVSGSSVIAYAAAAPFMTNNGIVQLGGERTARKAPRQTRRLFRRSGAWAYRVRITTDHLRGSGSVAPVAIATILNLHQGQTVQLESRLGPQTIAWTGIQPSFGTIRRFLLDEDVAAGTDAFLVIHDDGRFDFEQARELVSEPLSDALTLVGARPTTDPESARTALATAVGLPPDATIAAIIGDYRTRGDDDVADLVLAARECLEAGRIPAGSPHHADVDEILDLL